MEGLGLYIHIPFCKSKCHYCDFNSYSNKEFIQEEYIDCLLKEMASRSSILDNHKLKSIYIGGGTPTYLNLTALGKLLSFLEAYGREGMEYTCEANPGTLTREKLELLKEKGINRLSIGLQSWNDDILRKLGRIHCIKEFMENYEAARAMGFDNINIDLMFAIQGQTIEDLSNTLDNVIKLRPEHISCYSLIIEENTVFYEQYQKGQLKETDEDLDREMYYLTVQKLEDAGYHRYEISNFAKPGFESIHNKIYWNTEDYLGVGAGAHSCINNIRFSNERVPEKYMDSIKKSGLAVCWEEPLSLDDRMSEFMFMGLRLTEGISYNDFRKRFGTELNDIYGDKIEVLNKKGLLKVDPLGLALTEPGIDLSNQVFIEFIK